MHTGRRLLRKLREGRAWYGAPLAFGALGGVAIVVQALLLAREDAGDDALLETSPDYRALWHLEHELL